MFSRLGLVHEAVMASAAYVGPAVGLQALEHEADVSLLRRRTLSARTLER